MKVGDTYLCIKNYFFSYNCYFIENHKYTIREIQYFNDEIPIRIIFEFNDGPDEDMYMEPDEMEEHFIYQLEFKFGR